MYHSITIGDKNTWDDWHMIPVTPPVIAPPVEKTISLDVGDPTARYFTNITWAPDGKSLYLIELNRAGSSCKSTERRHRKADEAVCAAGG